MECAAVPLAALSTGHEIGLAVAGAIFITFALLSALVIPRWRPDFPGRWRGLFILVTIALFVGMMASVFVFGQGSEESEAAETTGAETTTAATTTTGPQGNPTAGKQVFAASGCGSCHTFEPAGSTGTVGPNLGEALKGKDATFIRTSIVDPNAVIAKGYPPNIMPQTFGQQLSTTQLNDLIAFLQR